MKGLALLLERMRYDPDVKLMVQVVCDTEGASSPAHLREVNRRAYDDLLEMVEDVFRELGEPQ